MVIEDIIKCKLLPLGESVLVFTNDKAYTVPFNENNADYQVYIQWLDAGNTAEAADVLV